MPRGLDQRRRYRTGGVPDRTTSDHSPPWRNRAISRTARPSKISRGVVAIVEQMKLLTILTTADIRGVGPGVWKRLEAQLVRTLYYETETGTDRRLLEVNRAQRIAAAQAEIRAESPSGRSRNSMLHRAALSRVLLKVELRARSAMPASCAPAKQGRPQAGNQCRLRMKRAASRELTILGDRSSLAAVDYRRACASAGATSSTRRFTPHRRARARHHRHHPGIRPRRGRGRRATRSAR